MTRPEDRLRAALDARAAAARPAPDALAMVRARVRRARRVRLVLVVGGTAAAVAGGIAYGAALVGEPDRPPVVTDPGPTPTPTPNPTPTPAATTATPSEGPVPAYTQESVAAVTHDHRVVMVSSLTGAVQHTLYAPRSGEETLGVAFAPDRAWVYFAVRPVEGGCGTVHRVRSAGGAVERVGRGEGPVLSPDGTRVAVHRPCEGSGYDVGVLDLATGTERTYRHDPLSPLGDGVPFDLAWEDDRTLLVLMGWEAGMGEVRRLDVDTDRRLADAERLSWDAATADDLTVGRGRTPLLAYTDHDEPPVDATAGWVDKVDRATGRRTRVFTVPGIVAESLAVDARGAVVYVGRDGALWRWHGDAKPQRVGGRFQAVDW